MQIWLDMCHVFLFKQSSQATTCGPICAKKTSREFHINFTKLPFFIGC